MKYQKDVYNFQGEFEAKHPTQKMSTVHNFAHTLRLDLFSMINLSFAITSSTFYDTINSITTSIKDLCHAIFLQRKKKKTRQKIES